MTKRNNILLVAITRLGDMLQMSPTIAGLKAENPEATITVVIDKEFAGICQGIPFIDEVYVLDIAFLIRNIYRENDGVVEAYKYLSEVVEDLKKKEFDYCLNMSNSAYTALLIKMLDVEENRGWLADDEGYRIMADPWAMLFAAFVYHSNRDFNSLNLVDIFRSAAEVKAHPHQLQYVVPEESKEFATQFLIDHNLDCDGPLICVQAGASQEKRQWATERFVALLKILINDLNARVVFTGSPAEAPVIDAILEQFPHPRAVSAVGKTSFGQLGGILSAADVLITGDTGPMHLSVAVGTPVVALFLASALCFETGPYSEGNFVLQPQISCNPCNPNYPCARPDCHSQISPELVAHLTALRLSTEMGKESELKIPQELADPNQVVVYYSSFDEDGYLDFYPMNGLIRKAGQPIGYLENAKDAYRVLWKKEFSDIDYPALPASAAPELPARWSHESLHGVQEAIKLSQEGIKALEMLRVAVEDTQCPAAQLTELNMFLQLLDRKIEEVSLAHPIIGAIVRIFIMEKENLRGDDPFSLIEHTSELYESLGRRSARFGQLFEHFQSSREIS